LYYSPGSLKARLCREGKAEIEAYAASKGIPIERRGKLVIAVEDGEVARLMDLRDRGLANGVPGLEVVGGERISELEPNVSALIGLWSPSTSVIDFTRIASAYAEDVRAAGGQIRTNWRVSEINIRRTGVTLRSATGEELDARYLVGCAGLWADRLARLAAKGKPNSAAVDDVQIVPFRGSYYELGPQSRKLINGLVYPVPDPRFPFLGVHFTKHHDGAVMVGPNAVLAMKRDGYRRSDISLGDAAATLTFPGFLRLATKYWREGASELWRDVSKRAYLSNVNRYVPAIELRDLVPGPSGVRAQAVDRDGRLVEDFDIRSVGPTLHVLNAPSPAATASLALGRMIALRATTQFSLGVA
jgi:L-2-hydroxyglutarate oxidase LhgO